MESVLLQEVLVLGSELVSVQHLQELVLVLAFVEQVLQQLLVFWQVRLLVLLLLQQTV